MNRDAEGGWVAEERGAVLSGVGVTTTIDEEDS